MSVLEKINSPLDVKKLNRDELPILACDIREKIIETINTNGGHLASNLGIVETTIALCKVFDFPKDKLLFDVGHQCYSYKLLTGRNKDFSTIRTNGGLSGFPDREESEYDSFIAGHAGNSIGASLGKCFARDNIGDDYFVIDIVGDGALANGVNLEALMADSKKPKKYIVILNDNGMSISRNTNGFYQFMSNRTLGQRYVKNKKRIKRLAGKKLTVALGKIKNFIKRIFKANDYFENFGFKYVGVYDGNNIETMVNLLEKVKKYAEDEAVLIHIKTKKGKGCCFAEEHSDDYHGVGANMSIKNGDFSKCVGETVNELIEKDKRIVAITAGMSGGTGLNVVKDKNPNNFYDVGIAEEYAVNLSAGMCSEGLKPIVCIYSTFLQRAYDQILHDVCLQNLPVVFCVDRAGLCGADGKTHQGVFDLSFLSHLPNLKIYSPKSVCELKQMIEYASRGSSPVVIRYPNEKDICDTACTFDEKWEIVKEGKDATILAVGVRMNDLANKIAESSKKSVGVVNARVVKPLDSELLDSIKDTHIITLEENALISGFGSLVNEYYMTKKMTVKISSYGVPDSFIKNATVKEQLDFCSLNKDKIVEDIEKE